jgi:hypothetical protein
VELQTIDAERARLEATRQPAVATAEKILELAKKAEILYKSQNPSEQRRLLETVLSNCTFDRKSQAHIHFAIRSAGERERNWKLAERVGFEPTCRLPDNTLSRRARYDHFGTSPSREIS